MHKCLITILCLLGSSGAFFCFFSFMKWINKHQEHQITAERFVARLAAYPICAFVVLMPYVLNNYVPDELSDALFLASVIICRVIAFLINRFWGPNAINNSFKSYIYGFILAFALITLYYEGWLPALPIFVYFISFYIDFNFGEHASKDNLVHNGKKGRNTAIKRIFTTIRKEYIPAIVNCIAIILAFIFIPPLDNFLKENWIAISLPWIVFISCYIFIVVYGKKQKNKGHEKAKNTKG